MKKSLAVVSAVAVATTLTACQKECEPVIETVEKIVEKEVIKEVKVPVEVPVEVPAEIDMERNYKPGTYFKATEADENGVITFATVVVDKYGRISGIHVDNTSVQNQYLYDEEAKQLYIFVRGIEDVIPDTYRKVTLGKANKTVDDAITSDDLIVGYPYYDQIIATLKPVKANETQGTIDFYSDEENTWSKQMAKLADKIIKDQTTYGINLYQAGNELKTNTIKGVDVAVGKEIKLIQSILDEDAKIGDTLLTTLDNKVKGTYKPGTYFNVSAPRVVDGVGVVYNTSLIVVDEFGSIAGVNLDETTSSNGTSTTKSILGDDLKEGTESFVKQADLLEEAVVRNQGIGGFKYVTVSDEKEVKNPFGTKEMKVPTKLTNVSGVDLTINNLLNTLKTSLDKQAKLELVDGVYTTKDEAGNMLTMVVEGGKVSGLNLDALTSVNQAYINIDGKDYELYTYDKGSLDLSLEEVKTPTLIYKDGDTYRHATDQGINKGYEVGDTVKFDYTGYDEKATIKPLQANSTKKALKDQYNMATAEDKLEWYEQARAYENYVVKNGFNAFNMTDNKHTDSVSGLTIGVDEYNSLLNKLVLSATDKENISKDYVKLDKASVLGSYKLANGSYVTTSDVPNKDNGLYVFSLIVTDNALYVSIDETILVDGKLTTKRALGEDYRVKVDADGELTKSNDKTDPTYAEYANKLLKDNATKFKFTNGLVDYDYELKSEIRYEKKDGPHVLVEDASENLLGYFNNAMEKALIQGLRARVTEASEKMVEKIEKDLENKFIVASYPASEGKVDIDLSSLLSIGGSDRNEAKFKVSIDSVERNTKVEDDKNGKFSLTAEAEDIPQSTMAKFKYVIEFDDYKAVEGEFSVNVMSNTDYKNRFLQAKDKDGKDLSPNLQNAYSNLLTGKEVVLDYHADAYTLNSLGNLGQVGARDINASLMFRIDNLTDVNATVTSLPATLRSGNKNESITLTYTTEGWKASKEIKKGDVIVLDTLGFELTSISDSTLSTENVLGLAKNFDIKKDGKAVTDNKEQVVAGLSKVAVKETYPVGTKIKVEAYNEKATATSEITGEFGVKAFFDAFEQRDTKDGLLSWQKGEPSRDFTFKVLNEKAALKQAKQSSGAGNLLDTVTTTLSGVKLTSKDDIKIDGVNVEWNILEGSEVATITTKDGKDELAITTDTKTHKVVLVATYTNASGQDLNGNSDEAKRQFDFTVKPTSAKEVEIKLLEQMSIDFLTPYVNLDEAYLDNTTLASFSVSADGVSDVKITWRDKDGRIIDSTQTLYNAIVKQTDLLKAGERSDVTFKVEIKYNYNEKEYTLNKTYELQAYTNKGLTAKENSATVVFDDVTNEAEVNDGIRIAIAYAKQNNLNQIVIPKVSVDNLDLDNFEGDVVIQGATNQALNLLNASKANVTVEGGTYTTIKYASQALLLASEEVPANGKLTLNNVTATTVSDVKYLVVNGNSNIKTIESSVASGVINYPAKVETNKATNVKQDWQAVSTADAFQEALQNNKVLNIYLEADLYSKDLTKGADGKDVDVNNKDQNVPIKQRYFNATQAKNIYGNGHKLINDSEINYNLTLSLNNSGASKAVYNVKDLTIINTHPKSSGVDISLNNTGTADLIVNLENVTLETNNTASNAFSTPLAVKFYQNSGKTYLTTKNVSINANSTVRDYTLKVILGNTDPKDMLDNINTLISAEDLKALSANTDANLLVVPFADGAYTEEQVKKLALYGNVYYLTDSNAPHKPLNEYKDFKTAE